MPGIIGWRRMVDDLWGETVTVVSRLESTGVPGAVHVSETTLHLCAQRSPVTIAGSRN